MPTSEKREVCVSLLMGERRGSSQQFFTHFPSPLCRINWGLFRADSSHSLNSVTNSRVGAVDGAELTGALFIGILPDGDKRAIHLHATGAPLHAGDAILVMGTCHTLVWILEMGEEMEQGEGKNTHLYLRCTGRGPVCFS